MEKLCAGTPTYEASWPLLIGSRMLLVTSADSCSIPLAYPYHLQVPRPHGRSCFSTHRLDCMLCHPCALVPGSRPMAVRSQHRLAWYGRMKGHTCRYMSSQGIGNIPGSIPARLSARSRGGMHLQNARFAWRPAKALLQMHACWMPDTRPARSYMIMEATAVGSADWQVSGARMLCCMLMQSGPWGKAHRA